MIDYLEFCARLPAKATRSATTTLSFAIVRRCAVCCGALPCGKLKGAVGGVPLPTMACTARLV
eukprot:1158316-Pelagomonas_calceolata.AAC.6